jgi:threonyl-tRNA synthetase
MVKVRFNGKNIDVKKGTRIQELVKDKGIIAARIDGRLKDLSTSITEDCSIELVDFSSEDGKRIYWHSTSHVMAMAVKELFPATKLAIGPAIDDGFYYDFEPQRPFSADDLRRIEKKMTEIIKKDIPFERIVMKKEAAKEFFSHQDENYKLELIDGIPDGEVSLYRN